MQLYLDKYLLQNNAVSDAYATSMQITNSNGHSQLCPLQRVDCVQDVVNVSHLSVDQLLQIVRFHLQPTNINENTENRY